MYSRPIELLVYKCYRATTTSEGLVLAVWQLLVRILEKRMLRLLRHQFQHVDHECALQDW